MTRWPDRIVRRTPAAALLLLPLLAHAGPGTPTTGSKPMPDPVAAARTAGAMPTVSLAPDAGPLLDYLARRILDTPEALPRQLRRSATVVAARVEKVISVAHPVSPALLARAAVDHLPIEKDKDGPRLYLQAAEVTVTDVLWGKAHAGPLRVLWLPPVDTGSAGPNLSGATSGILFLVEPEGTALASDLAASEPGAFVPGSEPTFVADGDGTVQRALRWWVRTSGLARAARIEEAAHILGSAHGLELSLALHALAAEGQAAAAVLSKELATNAGTSRGLALRAALWRIGERKAACKGLDVRSLDMAALAPWQAAAATDASLGRVGLVAPAADTATDWNAVAAPGAAGKGGHGR